MPEQTLKVVVVGDEKSGKTQLIRRLTGMPFDDSYISTIGVEFYTHITENNTKLRIWDTSGQLKYRSIVSVYYRASPLFIYCVDAANIDEEKIKRDIAPLKKESPAGEVLIVATQSDKLDKTIPTTINLADKQIPVLLTSAKNDTLDGIAELKSFLSDFAKKKYPPSLTNYPAVRNKLLEALKIYDTDTNSAEVQLTNLEKTLAPTSISNAQEKIAALQSFNTYCESALTNRPSLLQWIGELIALLAIPVLVGLIGFGVGFTLGLWAGPGAFLSGIIAGQAAALAVAAVTGASVLGSAGLGYYFFKPTPTPAVVNEFNVATREEFKLSAPAA